MEKSAGIHLHLGRMYDTAVCLQQTFYALYDLSACGTCGGDVSVSAKGYPEYRDGDDDCIDS